MVKSFTLIELLIVIVIIGIIATALIPRLTWAQAIARDKARLLDMRQVQAAIQRYYDINKSYPIAYGRRWNCSGRGWHPTSGPNGYIPGLAPDYLISLPLDPKPTSSVNCYLYKSDWTDYMFLIYKTVEGTIPDELKRPLAPAENNFAVYSPGAKMR